MQSVVSEEFFPHGNFEFQMLNRQDQGKRICFLLALLHSERNTFFLPSARKLLLSSFGATMCGDGRDLPCVRPFMTASFQSRFLRGAKQHLLVETQFLINEDTFTSLLIFLDTPYLKTQAVSLCCCLPIVHSSSRATIFVRYSSV
jgi:hypothetical protein